MRKSLVLFLLILMLPMVACSVLQGEIDGNIELNGSELHTDNNGSVVIKTPNPTKNLPNFIISPFYFKYLI